MRTRKRKLESGWEKDLQQAPPEPDWGWQGDCPAKGVWSVQSRTAETERHTHRDRGRGKERQRDRKEDRGREGENQRVSVIQGETERHQERCRDPKADRETEGHTKR